MWSFGICIASAIFRRKHKYEMCKEPGYSCYKLPFGSSNFSFNLSLHDSFSIGIIKFSSVEKKMKTKKKMERQL